MKAAAEIRIVNPEDTVRRVSKHYSMSDTEQNSVLMHFLADRDMSLYGLVNAVTRTAQDAYSYDRATEMEKLGSVLLYDGIGAINHPNNNHWLGEFKQ